MTLGRCARAHTSAERHGSFAGSDQGETFRENASHGPSKSHASNGASYKYPYFLLWVCECDEAFSWDDYFWGKSYRRKRFTPPDLRAFLLELLCELPDDLSRQAAQEREERARQRATCAERTVSIGTTRPPRPCCPNPLEWLPMAIYI